MDAALADTRTSNSLVKLAARLGYLLCAREIERTASNPGKALSNAQQTQMSTSPASLETAPLVANTTEVASNTPTKGTPAPSVRLADDSQRIDPTEQALPAADVLPPAEVESTLPGRKSTSSQKIGPAGPEMIADAKEMDVKSPITRSNTTGLSTKLGQLEETKLVETGSVAMSPDMTGPRRAGGAQYFGMQFLAHLGPVGGTRTVAQGLIGPAVAGLVFTNTKTALAIETAVAVFDALPRVISHWRSEQNPSKSNAEYNGYNGDVSSLQRRITQFGQSGSISLVDVGALLLTGLSMVSSSHLMKYMAAMGADIMVRAKFAGRTREVLRPLITTVAVGNPLIELPEFRGAVRAEDITLVHQLIYGGVGGLTEFGSSMTMHFITGGLESWEVGVPLALGAAGIAGLANTVTSTVEDTLIATASEKRLKAEGGEHETQNRHIIWPPTSGNPLTATNALRQLQRADARIFNLEAPPAVTLAIFAGMLKAIAFRPGDITGALSYAALAATVVSLIYAYNMPRTAQLYQHNDMSRGVNPGHVFNRSTERPTTSGRPTMELPQLTDRPANHDQGETIGASQRQVETA